MAKKGVKRVKRVLEEDVKVGVSVDEMSVPEVVELLEEIGKVEEEKEREVLPEGYGVNGDGSLTVVYEGMLYELPSGVCQLVSSVVNKSLRIGQWYRR